MPKGADLKENGKKVIYNIFIDSLYIDNAASLVLMLS